MKLTLKKFAFVLSLGLGLGASGSVLAFAAPGDFDCELWELKCSQGNATACTKWTINCQTYGGE